MTERMHKPHASREWKHLKHEVPSSIHLRVRVTYTWTAEGNQLNSFISPKPSTPLPSPPPRVSDLAIITMGDSFTPSFLMSPGDYYPPPPPPLPPPAAAASRSGSDHKPATPPLTTASPMVTTTPTASPTPSTTTTIHGARDLRLAIKTAAVHGHPRAYLFAVAHPSDWTDVISQLQDHVAAVEMAVGSSSPVLVQQDSNINHNKTATPSTSTTSKHTTTTTATTAAAKNPPPVPPHHAPPACFTSTTSATCLMTPTQPTMCTNPPPPHATDILSFPACPPVEQHPETRQKQHDPYDFSGWFDSIPALPESAFAPPVGGSAPESWYRVEGHGRGCGEKEVWGVEANGGGGGGGGTVEVGNKRTGVERVGVGKKSYAPPGTVSRVPEGLVLTSVEGGEEEESMWEKLQRFRGDD
ncbi:hypothetical protein CONLIGDRAFT_465669 [Coniochaeta ligniaria NRRL 30616]|uniref:Uncharacterized protein n=1 Tax=Coniochaeta ligniaria NRRL 30616 TaxID=1408157 RepID=A0A1J7J3M4_9PEZI|nr:hypothetical protein CONLIGDRAFT_465669 [Coniochaeta ligniaria NRRL 30616]